jgi:hypothetical protein
MTLGVSLWSRAPPRRPARRADPNSHGRARPRPRYSALYQTRWVDTFGRAVTPEVAVRRPVPTVRARPLLEAGAQAEVTKAAPAPALPQQTLPQRTCGADVSALGRLAWPPTEIAPAHRLAVWRPGAAVAHRAELAVSHWLCCTRSLPGHGVRPNRFVNYGEWAGSYSRRSTEEQANRCSDRTAGAGLLSARGGAKASLLTTSSMLERQWAMSD